MTNMNAVMADKLTRRGVVVSAPAGEQRLRDAAEAPRLVLEQRRAPRARA